MSKLTAERDQQYIISDYDLEEIGRRGHGRVNAQVHGYWSQDPMTLHIDRDWRWDPTSDDKIRHSWKFTISHSSGGRDTKEVEDDASAATNFALALVHLAGLARSLKGKVAELEAWSLDQRRLDKEAEAAEKAKEQAAIDADPRMGFDAAAGMLIEAGKQCKYLGFKNIMARPRGTSRQVTIFQLRKGRDEKIRYYKAGVMVKQMDVASELAEFAADSYIQQD